MVVAATVETFTDDQLVWPAVSLVTTAGLAFLLPWRRVRPLLVVAVSFGTVSAIEVASILGDVEWDGLNAAAFMLVLPYALARWASGRDVGIGLGVVAVPIALSVVAGDQFGVNCRCRGWGEGAHAARPIASELSRNGSEERTACASARYSRRSAGSPARS